MNREKALASDDQQPNDATACLARLDLSMLRCSGVTSPLIAIDVIGVTDRA